MIKSIAGVRRRDGVTREQLRERWEHTHAPFVVEHANPAHYRVTFFDGTADDAPARYDGLAELWFRDRAHRDAWFAGPTRGTDGFGEFTDGAGGFRMITSEHVIVDGDVSRADEKVVYLLKRRADVPPERFFALWLDIHAPNVRAGVERTDGCLRYVISHADLGEPGDFDGVAEIWWRDAAARQRGLQGVEADGFGDLIDAEATVVLLGHEFTVVD